MRVRGKVVVGKRWSLIPVVAQPRFYCIMDWSIIEVWPSSKNTRHKHKSITHVPEVHGAFMEFGCAGHVRTMCVSQARNGGARKLVICCAFTPVFTACTRHLAHDPFRVENTPQILESRHPAYTFSNSAPQNT